MIRMLNFAFFVELIKDNGFMVKIHPSYQSILRALVCESSRSIVKYKGNKFSVYSLASNKQTCLFILSLKISGSFLFDISEKKIKIGWILYILTEIVHWNMTIQRVLKGFSGLFHKLFREFFALCDYFITYVY